MTRVQLRLAVWFCALCWCVLCWYIGYRLVQAVLGW